MQKYLFIVLFSILVSCTNADEQWEANFEYYVNFHFYKIQKMFNEKSTLNEIENYLKTIPMHGGYPFIIDSNGTLIVHPNSSLKGQQVNKYLPFANMMLEKKNGTMKYVFNRVEKTIAFRILPDNKLVVVFMTFTDKLKMFPQKSSTTPQ